MCNISDAPSGEQLHDAEVLRVLTCEVLVLLDAAKAKPRGTKVMRQVMGIEIRNEITYAQRLHLMCLLGWPGRRGAREKNCLMSAVG